jgi:hypothetical protein
VLAVHRYARQLREVATSRGCCAVHVEEAGSSFGPPLPHREMFTQLAEVFGDSSRRKVATSDSAVWAAAQLATLPWLDPVPDECLRRHGSGSQLSGAAGLGPYGLEGCGKREQTRSDHPRLVAEYRGTEGFGPGSGARVRLLPSNSAARTG